MAIVTFWINSFIPKDVPGYTETLSAGTHSGKTAIPLPSVARLWPGNTVKDWNCGYLTDQRTFSQKYGASSRMSSFVRFDTDPDEWKIVQQVHGSSGTTEVNRKTGDETGFEFADMSRCSFTQDIPMDPQPPRSLGGFPQPRLPVVRPNTADLVLVAAAGDPLVGMAADIDYGGRIRITVAGASINVNFEGKIDDFPAYECYVKIGTETKTLFTIAPPAGKTVADLLGAASRPVRASASFP